jgi:hypothetical protein
MMGAVADTGDALIVSVSSLLRKFTVVSTDQPPSAPTTSPEIQQQPENLHRLNDHQLTLTTITMKRT